MISAILFRTISLAHEDSLADVLKIGLTDHVLENPDDVHLTAINSLIRPRMVAKLFLSPSMSPSA